MDATSNRITIGTVDTLVSQLQVILVKEASGKQDLCLFINPKDGRRNGEIIVLNLAEIGKLKQLIATAEGQIQTVTGSDGTIICPNCKVPQREGVPSKTCQFCGFVRT